MTDHTTILDVNLGLRWVVQPSKGMLHPFLVVTLQMYQSICMSEERRITYLGEVLAGMRTTRLLPRCCSSDRLHGTLEKVAELKRLDKIPVWQV